MMVMKKDISYIYSVVDHLQKLHLFGLEKKIVFLNFCSLTIICKSMVFKLTAVRVIYNNTQSSSLK